MAFLLYAAVAIGIVLLVRRSTGARWRIAAVLALLPLCITGTALFTGRAYAPVDLLYGFEPLASAAEKAGITRTANVHLSDVAAEFIPWHAATREAFAHGQWPLWNRFESCGTIHAAAAQAAPWHPVHLLSLLLPRLPDALTVIATLLFLLAAVSAFLFARDLTGSDDAALFAGAAWMFSSHLLSFTGTALGMAMAGLPLVFLGARRIVHAPGERAAGVLTLGLSLLVLSGHPETILHVVALAVVYFLFEFAVSRGSAADSAAEPLPPASRRRHHWKAVIASGLAAGAIALALCAVAIVPMFEAMPDTEDYRFRANVLAREHPESSLARVAHEFAVAFLPLIDGDSSSEERRHSPQTAHWWVGSAYAGSLLFPLALAALIRSRDARRWFFSGFFLWGVLTGANAPGVVDLLERLPLFAISVNDRMIWSAAFGMTMLAAMGIAHARAREFVVVASIIAVSIAVSWSALIGGGLSREFLATHSFRAIAPLLIGALLIPSRAWLLMPLLLVQRAGETAEQRPIVDRRAFAPHFAGLELLRGDAPFRIVGQGALFPPGTATLYGLEDVRGFTAMELARFVDVQKLWSARPPVWSNRVDDLSSPFLSLMNVRFALAEPQSQPPPGWIRRAAYPGYQIFENTKALPRAFVPRTVHLGVHESARFIGMSACRDFGGEAWIESGDEWKSVANGPGVVATRRVGARMHLRASMQGPGWVVVSETATPGWRARVPLAIANHTFLALYLPAGEHEVTLDYLPRGFVIGGWISIATLLALAIRIGFRARS